MGYPVRSGSTSVKIHVDFIDSSTGGNFTSAAYNSAGMSIMYIRDGGSPTTITLSALSSAGAAYSSGGFLHLTMGTCRLDLPDAVCAAGVGFASIVGSATGALMARARIDLNLENAADVAGSVWDEDLSTHTTAGTSGYKVGSMTYTQANLLNVRVNNVAGVTLQTNGTGNQNIGST